MNPFILTLIGSGVRWLLTVAAARGVVTSEDQATQIVSGVVAVAMLGWSGWQKYRADQQITRR